MDEADQAFTQVTTNWFYLGISFYWRYRNIILFKLATLQYLTLFWKLKSSEKLKMIIKFNL